MVEPHKNSPHGLNETEQTAPSEPTYSPSARRSPHWVLRLLGWGLFLVAAIFGLRYGDQILQRTKSLIPPPSAKREVKYWVSPMNPDVRSDQPGKDQMGMNLVPVYEGEEPLSPVTIRPNLQEQNVTTERVRRGPMVHTVHTESTVVFAEPLVGDVTLKVDAWLEKLYVTYEGQAVKKGAPLVDVYAPSLVATEEELLSNLDAVDEARKASREVQEVDQQNLESVREKLRFMDVTDEQITRLEQDRDVKRDLTFYSPFQGIVVEKNAFEGKYFPAGQLLYRVADLSKVWVYAYVYQNQIHCISEGQEATLTVPELPGRKFQGKVLYVYPYLEPKIRAVKVRLEFENPDLLLKPDMFTHVAFAPTQLGTGLNVSRGAVLKTGVRELVYVVLPDHQFAAREVKTGRVLDGNRVEILSGLREGEEIVTSESYLMDSESRLRSVDRKFNPLPSSPMKMQSNPETKKPPKKQND